MDEYLQELFKITMIYVSDDEFNFLGGAHAAELADKRDEQAAEQLRRDCEDK